MGANRENHHHHLPPSFYVILHRDAFLHTLTIPTDFVNNHLQAQPIDSFLLKTSRSSRSWLIRTEKTGQIYVLKSGWSDFATDNTLERGDILVFWLTSDSTFLVKLAVKKPLNICENEKHVGVEEGTTTKNPCCEVTITKDRRDRINLLMRFVRETGVLMKESHTVLRNAEGRTWRVKTWSGSSSFLLSTGWKDFHDQNGLKVWDVCSFEFRRDEGNLMDVRVVDKNEKETGFEESIGENEKHVGVEEGTTTKNPCCEVTITRDRRTKINLLMWFVRETGVLLKESHTVLRNAEGRTWRVETWSGSSAFVLTKGWKDFPDQNGLKVGDDCSFEFRRDEGNLMDVRVVDKNEDTGFEESIGADKKTVSVEEDTKTQNSRCEVTITKRSTSRINLPMRFVRETGVLLKKNHTVLRNKEGRKWSVETYFKKKGPVNTFELTFGWINFVEQNGLEELDVCSFVFRRKEGNLIDVRVLNKRTGSKQDIHEKTVMMEEEATTKNPWCKVRITKSRTHRMYLLMPFVRETGVLLKEEHTVLRNKYGRTWRVTICLRKDRYRFELCWKEFLCQNGIKESDICSFEFRRDEGNLIDVRVLNWYD